MTNRAIQSPHRVVALVYDQLCSFEFGIAAEVFGLPRPEFERSLYEFRSVALEDGPLSAAGGLEISPSSSLAVLHAADTIIIPGWRGKNAVVPDQICKALAKAHAKRTRLMSICSGVYVLAAAGILSGKSVTTHWRYANHLSEMYPDIVVDPNALYVQDGNIITSAGSAAGIDACLYMVRTDYGAETANSFARRLVMPAHRQGDQAQFVEQPVPIAYGADRLSGLMDEVRGQLAAEHNVASMARIAGMSTRTFQRRFVSVTGISPMKWVSQERIARARLLLETTVLSVDEVSFAVGLKNAEALRYHFRQELDLSPASYRKHFRQTG